MSTSRNAEPQVAEPIPAMLRPRKQGTAWYRLASLLFGGKPASEKVATRVHFNASSDVVWNHIMLYEDVPGRPPFLLRAFLPHPLRSEGDKTCVGSLVHCVYRAGDLIKRITTVTPPHFLQFEVIQQRLGIEGCILTLGGSYQLNSCGEATDVVLITNYQAFLRPRRLWRPLEALLVRQLHRHILRGVCAAVFPGNPSIRLAGAESFTPQSAPARGLACTVSPSRSRR
ncbi:MAG: hypothetical protein WCE61_06690 [Candidatus Acidiferrum sp.]